jgi:hypothetical protein
VSLLGDRHTAGFERDLLAVLGRDLSVNMELGAAVGAEVD